MVPKEFSSFPILIQQTIGIRLRFSSPDDPAFHLQMSLTAEYLDVCATRMNFIPLEISLSSRSAIS
jgi:hypothetical protein